VLETKMEEALEWLLILSLVVKESHWNLRGKEFFYLHEKLDELYSDITEYADELAERARANGWYLAPKVSYEMSGESVSYHQVVDNLVSSLRGLTGTLQNAILNITDDLATQDVLIEIKRGIDKWLWMFNESAK
jgi:starvation-inducible DNA-binding protein